MIKLIAKTFVFILFFTTLLAYANPCPCTNEDPYENFNRGVFSMNRNLDTYFLKPIACFYARNVPNIAQKGVHNFFNNLREIPALFNDILQLDGLQSLADGWRLAINSTIGIGGLIDVADKMGLPQHNNDFGLTLVRYGYTNSSYFVIPFYGPSTIRDAGALIPYGFQTVYFYIQPPGLAWGLFGGDLLDMRVQYLKAEAIAQQAGIDPYAFQRNAYLQYRRKQITNEFCGCSAQTPIHPSIERDVDQALIDEKRDNS